MAKQTRKGRKRAFFCIRQDIVDDVYLSLFYTEMKKFAKTFKPRGMNASTYYLLSIDERHNNLVAGARWD